MARVPASHFEATVHHDIDLSCIRLPEMLVLDEQALTRAIDAIVKCDRQLVYSVILRGQDVGAQDVLVDQFCLEFIVRHQPAAGHLRFVYSASSSTSVGRFVLAGPCPESGARAQCSRLCCSRPAGELRRPAAGRMSFLAIWRSEQFRNTKRCAGSGKCRRGGSEVRMFPDKPGRRQAVRSAHWRSPHRVPLGATFSTLPKLQRPNAEHGVAALGLLVSHPRLATAH